MIYFVYAQGLGRVKIGYTSDDDPQGRLSGLQVGCPAELILLHAMPGDPVDERTIHREFAAEHIRGEWFVYDGNVKRFLDRVCEVPIEDEVAYPPTTVEGRHIAEMVSKLNIALDSMVHRDQFDGRIALLSYRSTLETMLRLWGDIVGEHIPCYEHPSDYRASETFDRDVERLLRWMRRHAEQGRQLRLDSAREKLEAL